MKYVGLLLYTMPYCNAVDMQL